MARYYESSPQLSPEMDAPYTAFAADWERRDGHHAQRARSHEGLHQTSIIAPAYGADYDERLYGRDYDADRNTSLRIVRAEGGGHHGHASHVSVSHRSERERSREPPAPVVEETEIHHLHHHVHHNIDHGLLLLLPPDE
jgi:hypothetical protein